MRSLTSATRLAAMGLVCFVAFTSVEMPAFAGTLKKSYIVGVAYRMKGRVYHPREDLGYDRVGVASWYGSYFHGRRTANGETYDMNALTAAHPTLPLPTVVRVTNLENGRNVVVRINDRGPYAKDRIIDMSRAGAEALGFEDKGTARVRVSVIRNATLALKDGTGPAKREGEETPAATTSRWPRKTRRARGQ